LPAGVAPRVVLGQRSVAGETIIGIVGLDIPVTGTSQ
jgi:phosphatidylserine decarboxylase